MKNPQPEKPTREDILQRIAECPPEVFDGHTEFEKLSYQERLRWLSHTVHFVYTVAQHNPGLGCNALFHG